MANWSVHRLDGSLGNWSEEWNLLNRSLYSTHPLFDSRFIDRLLHYFGSGREYLCICRGNGLVTGMTILTPKQLGVWQTFSPSQLPIHPVLFPNQKAMHGIFKALPRSAWQINFLCQDPCYSPFLGNSSEYLPTTDENYALTIQVDSRLDFSQYWDSRPRKLRQNMRRYASRIGNQGYNQRIETTDRSSSMTAAVARFGELESGGWKGRLGTAVNIRNSQGRFYADVLAKFANTHQACVYELYLNDKPAASRLLIKGPTMTVALKTSYDESLKEYSPGRLLLLETLRQEIGPESTRESFEFYTNATRDQIHWASSQRWIKHVSLYRNLPTRILQQLASLRHTLRSTKP